MSRLFRLTAFALVALLLAGQHSWARLPFGLSSVAHALPAANYRLGATSERAPAAASVRIDSQAIVAFSPNGQATDVIVRAIERARSQILVQAYGFTSRPILQALARARERGVDVRVILDKSNDTERYSGATFIAHHGIPLWIDDTVRIAHNKVMVIDGRSVLTGSFNFTYAAQRDNAENILLIEDAPALAQRYLENWNWRRSLSRPFAG